MWFLVKISIAVIAFFVRLTKKTINWNYGTETRAMGDTDYKVTVSTDKHGNVLKTFYHTPFDCKAVFKLTEESLWDSFFKDLRMADEMQTNHPDFDRKIYIASDNYNFRNELQHDAKSRELILQLFTMECKFISCDGATLTIAFDGDKKNSHEALHTFHQFVMQIADLKAAATGIFSDQYAVKILATEAVIWCLAGYALTCYAEYMFIKDDIHLEKLRVVYYGLGVGSAIAFAIFIFIVLFLKGSSRGHRIIVESFLVLAAALPVGGVGVVADINKNFDENPTILATSKIQNLYQQQHRGRKGRTYYTYHLVHAGLPNVGKVPFPKHVELSYDTYRVLQGASSVEFEVAPGRLGLPWFKSIGPGTSGEY